MPREIDAQRARVMLPGHDRPARTAADYRRHEVIARRFMEESATSLKYWRGQVEHWRARRMIAEQKEREQEAADEV